MQKNNKKVWLIAIPLVLVISYFIYESLSQKSIKSLSGEFEEVAFVRNDQNKGGIIRIYAVTVGDIANADFDACVSYFPVNDYGSKTTIYFFDKKEPYPTTLSLDPPHFDTSAYRAISIIKRTATQN